METGKAKIEDYLQAGQLNRAHVFKALHDLGLKRELNCDDVVEEARDIAHQTDCQRAEKLLKYLDFRYDAITGRTSNILDRVWASELVNSMMESRVRIVCHLFRVAVQVQ